jgi:hypothetical protein
LRKSSRLALSLALVTVSLPLISVSCGVTDTTTATTDAPESSDERAARVAQSVVDAINADPTAATADPEALQARVDQAFALALTEEPQRGNMTPDAIYSKYECIEPPWHCPSQTRCPGSICVPTNCGSGKCPGCPSGGWGNLVIKNWCVYGCMRGAQEAGTAIIVHTAPFNRLSVRFGGSAAARGPVAS